MTRGKWVQYLNPPAASISPSTGHKNQVRKDKVVEKRKRVVPTKRFRANTVPNPSEAAVCPPRTISKAPTNIKHQAQEGTSDSRPPPLEDAPVCKSMP